MNKTEEFLNASNKLAIRFGDIVERINKQGIDVPYKPIRELKRLDCINLLDNTDKLKEYGKMVQGNSIGNYLNYLPFLNEGVIRVDGCLFRSEQGLVKKAWNILLWFKVREVDFEQQYFSVSIAQYEQLKKGGRTDFMRCFDAYIRHDGIGFKDGLTEADIAYCAYNAGLLTNVEKAWYEMVFRTLDITDKDYQHKKVDQENGYLNIFAAAFLWLNQLIEETNKLRKEQTIGDVDNAADIESQKKDQNKVVVRKDKKTGRRKIFIGGAVIECGEKSQVKIKRNKIVRQTQCWGVRGHYRHYASGKVVYIAPYEKGPNRQQKPKGKIYKVNPNVTS